MIALGSMVVEIGRQLEDAGAREAASCPAYVVEESGREVRMSWWRWRPWFCAFNKPLGVSLKMFMPLL